MRLLAERWGVSRSAIWRHVSNGHIGSDVAGLVDGDQMDRAMALVDRVEAILQMLERAAGRIDSRLANSTDHRAAEMDERRLARVAHEVRGTCELLARLLGDLGPSTVVQMDPVVVRALLSALAAFPEARVAAAQALVAAGELHLPAEAR